MTSGGSYLDCMHAGMSLSEFQEARLDAQRLERGTTTSRHDRLDELIDERNELVLDQWLERRARLRRTNERLFAIGVRPIPLPPRPVMRTRAQEARKRSAGADAARTRAPANGVILQGTIIRPGIGTILEVR